MNKGKTVKIFLLDGEPTGSKTVELSNWNGKAYLIPRNKLPDISKDNDSKDELMSQCVYLLIGNSEEGKRVVYVGEAETYLTRINQHNKNKDFWNLAICFITKDENLTKAHVKYLESRLVQKIKEADRVLLENSSGPAETKLPRPEKAEMEEFLSNMEIVLASIGYTFTQNIKKTKRKGFYIFKNKSPIAAGDLTNEGFVVYPVSKVVKREAPSVNKGLSRLRQDAIEKKLLKDGGDFYLLVEQYIFTSPSYAA